MDVTKPNEFIGCGVTGVTEPYEFVRFLGGLMFTGGVIPKRRQYPKISDFGIPKLKGKPYLNLLRPYYKLKPSETILKPALEGIPKRLRCPAAPARPGPRHTPRAPGPPEPRGPVKDPDAHGPAVLALLSGVFQFL